jgi:hypothetical protein
MGNKAKSRSQESLAKKLLAGLQQIARSQELEPGFGDDQYFFSVGERGMPLGRLNRARHRDLISDVLAHLDWSSRFSGAYIESVINRVLLRIADGPEHDHAPVVEATEVDPGFRTGG